MIHIRTPKEIEIMRESNRLVAQVLQRLSDAIKPGVTTKELDHLAERLIRTAGATPAFKGYRGYPATLCVSIDEEVVHGIPVSRQLKQGEIVSLDVGAFLNEYYGDAAITVPVGKVSKEAVRLLEVSRQALAKGIEQARDGNRLLDISYAIQSWVESHGFSVVRDFVGHGIGRNLHEDPQVPNFGPPHAGPRLRPGMVLAIEPMINVGTWEVKVLDDGWTVVTADGRLSAHFEHTIAITEKEADILSLP
ncbi:MAG: type I methionyl aminopeptidase [Deltaproteobacteria bacterium RBG_16_54_11]|jgi:methionyl aminopeptidase|nr:MAG: type I methionyl aminopeptidase [Deltaproteobacteria bacterium RBG_16_54_11]